MSPRRPGDPQRREADAAAARRSGVDISLDSSHDQAAASPVASTSQHPPPAQRRALLVGGAVLLVALVVLVVVLTLGNGRATDTQAATASANPSPTALATPPATATAPAAGLASPVGAARSLAAPAIAEQSIAELLAGHSTDWRVVRLRENPAVLAIEFPNLAEQGAAMNRVAALLEKADAPRDRVLSDSDLAALITRAGDNPQTFYQGHDYDGAGLARFYAQVARQHQALNAQEERLQWLLQTSGLLSKAADGLAAPGAQALITFSATQADDPRTPIDETLDERRRDSVLRHELSHGHFFTRPAYRAHCQRFWREVLTEAQRERMRRYLVTLGYDRSNEELMLNETQAFWMHTPDTRAFNAGLVGMADEELAELRARFWKTLPADADPPPADPPPTGSPRAETLAGRPAPTPPPPTR